MVDEYVLRDLCLSEGDVCDFDGDMVEVLLEPLSIEEAARTEWKLEDTIQGNVVAVTVTTITPESTTKTRKPQPRMMTERRRDQLRQAAQTSRTKQKMEQIFLLHRELDLCQDLHVVARYLAQL